MAVMLWAGCLNRRQAFLFFFFCLSLGGSFVRVPTCSQPAWALMDDGRRLCECWALGLVRTFQQPGCPFLRLKWVRPIRDPVLAPPGSCLERGPCSLTRTVALCRTVQGHSLSSVICLITRQTPLSLTNKPFFLFLSWFICSFLFSLKNIYSASVRILTPFSWIFDLFCSCFSFPRGRLDSQEI